jgi:hypothetical protein
MSGSDRGHPLDEPGLSVVPQEDAGAQTLSRYAFQWNCAVPFALATLDQTNPIRAIVCETHEDIFVLHEHGPELVSVKHRELSQPPWTLSELVQAPLEHLAERWLATGQRARCRLMTNHSLRPGDGEAAGLRDACSSRTPVLIRPWAQRLADRLALTEDAALAMLSGLTLECGLPSRNDIASVYCFHKLRPLMRRLGLPLDADQVAYERVVGQIARASMDRTRAPDALLEAMLAEDGHAAVAVLRRRIAQRTLTADDIASCLRGLPTTSPRLSDTSTAPPPTNLVRKLRAGELGPTAVGAAQRLRAAWYDLEARWRGLPGGGEDFGDLRIRAQSLAGEVESELADGAPYGTRMHTRLAQRLAAGELLGDAPVLLDKELLLGLIFQLTDECEIWWSPPSAVP